MMSSRPGSWLERQSRNWSCEFGSRSRQRLIYNWCLCHQHFQPVRITYRLQLVKTRTILFYKMFILVKMFYAGTYLVLFLYVYITIYKVQLMKVNSALSSLYYTVRYHSTVYTTNVKPKAFTINGVTKQK
jgi:hypothetical protein